MVGGPATGQAGSGSLYTDESGLFDCPRCAGKAAPKSFHSESYRLDRATSYDLTIIVCAVCSRDSVYVRRWGFDSSHAVADTGDFIEQYHMYGKEDTTTAWIRRVSTPHGRRLLALANTDETFLSPYRAACQTSEVCPEASAAMARRCLNLVLASQGYDQDCLIAQIDAAYKDQNPKKRLPYEARSALDKLRRFDNFGKPGNTIVRPYDVRPIGKGEAETTIAAAEHLMDYYFEAPLRVDDDLEALRKALGSGDL